MYVILHLMSKYVCYIYSNALQFVKTGVQAIKAECQQVDIQ